MEESTDGLRKSAPNWSLEGDKQLLDLLQSMHQKILEKCQATNKNLEDMVSALNSASIHLQNVNNKFTSLSNSQFIESRVYDDDDVPCPEVPEKPKEQPADPRQMDEKSFRESLAVLERLHESVTILCDSDTDDSDEESVARLVVKPKDLYASRPLPYIIGSQQWKRKWHAGLIAEDSDTDSEASSKPAREQYSDSDTERSERLPPRSPTISSCSIDSRNHSSDIVSSAPAEAEPKPKTQSDLAAELARRLGGATKAPVIEQEHLEPAPVVRKLYKPHQPAPGAIFSDEPPPLESDHSEESEHDIFAEIYKTSSYAHGDKDRVSVADDLFGKPIFDDEVPPPVITQKPTSKEQPRRPTENTPSDLQGLEKDDVCAKKPVGGKSLFGSSANSKSIGAAILKRKSHHSSTSGDESDHEPPPVATSVKKSAVVNSDNRSTEINNESHAKKERDIFDELFAKSERANKELDKKQKTEPVKEIFQAPSKNVRKVDLFSDNIFDDIDDMFTANVTKETKEKTPSKSLFDEEDDDLFSGIAVNKTNTKHVEINNKKSKKNTDTDLFREIRKEKTPEVDKKIDVVNKISNFRKESKGLFDDSDDDLFSDFSKPKTIQAVTSISKYCSNELFSDDKNLVKNSTPERKTKGSPELMFNQSESYTTAISETSKIVQSPDVFNDDLIYKDLQKSDNKIDDFKSVVTKNDNCYISKPMPVDAVEQDGSKYTIANNTQTKESGKTISKVKSSLFDEDMEQDIFENPSASDLSSSNDKIFDDSYITEDKSNGSLGKKDIIADETNSTNSQLDAQVNAKLQTNTKSGNETTIANAQVVISEDKQVSSALPNTEISVKPTVKTTNISTEVSQVQQFDVAKHLNITKSSNFRKDLSPDIFPEETDSPVSNKAEIPESKLNKDIFTDIFNDQPPEFEKPREPKRSKNINALFDDDSDDESLFLKKNDVISDERPEGFTSGADRLFGLFRDEPPPTDIDFVQKVHKKDDTESTDIKRETKRPNTMKPNIFDNDDDLFSANESDKSRNKDEIDTFNRIDTNISRVIESEHSKTSKPENIFKSDDVKSVTQDTTESAQLEPKKIGKLKPTNLNINVNSLLPGASPKKMVKSEVNNPPIQTVDKTDEVDEPENVESKLVKSVSFEDNPDSVVLDNKLSKERAKIKVKRRPSTRRARREAVKSSGIDFGEDFTDNSTAIDSSKHKSNNEKNSEEKTNDAQEISPLDDVISTSGKGNLEYMDDSDQDKSITTSESTRTNENAINIKVITNESVKGAKDAIFKDIKASNDMNERKVDSTLNSTPEKEIKSKVVYVLNDDDIFNTDTVNKDLNYSNTTFDSQESDEIFKTVALPKDEESSNSKLSEECKPKAEIVDNDSDDLFKKVSTSATKLRDSKFGKTTSEGVGNLFKNIPTLVTSQTEQSNMVKTKTFRSDSDTDDLFKNTCKPVLASVNTDSDENIFKNTATPVLKTESLNINTNFVDNEDNLFQNFTSPSIKEKTASAQISILSDEDDNLFNNTAKPSLKNPDADNDDKRKPSIFDSDEDLFKNNNKIVKKDAKPLLFDSDSDEELFSGKKKTKERQRKDKKVIMEKKTEVRKVDKKMSLFGDDSDDEDDLFGAKKKTTEPKTRPSSSKELPKETSVKSKTVLKDPLSLFGDDD